MHRRWRHAWHRWGRAHPTGSPPAQGWIPGEGGRVFPLSQAGIGPQFEVVRILHAGGVAQRLRPMGLAPGSPVRVVRGAPFWGPIVVEIPGRVLALGRGVASKILVRAIPAQPEEAPSTPGSSGADPVTGGR